MNELMIKENVKIEKLIYEVRGKQVMLDSKISVTKCNDSIVTYNDIEISISMCNKLRKTRN